MELGRGQTARKKQFARPRLISQPIHTHPHNKPIGGHGLLLEREEASRFFITPPEGITADVSPQPVPLAQQSFLDRFDVLLHDMDNR